MAKLTHHAKQRLFERFGICEDESLKIIGSMFNNKYHLVGADKGDELRQIVFEGLEIQGVVSGGKIVTCYPPTIYLLGESVDTELDEYVKYAEARIEIAKKFERLLLKKDFLTSFKIFLKLRKKGIDYFK